MKNILKIKSMMLTMLAMLAVSAMTISMTACSDDDDDNAWPSNFTNKLIYDGESEDIEKVEVSEFDFKGVECYVIYLVTDKGGFQIEVPKKSLGKLLDLTKDQSVSPESPVTASIDGADAYGDGSFEKGSTMQVAINGNKIKIVAKGAAVRTGLKPLTEKVSVIVDQRLKAPAKVTLPSFTFDINYSGEFSREIPKLK